MKKQSTIVHQCKYNIVPRYYISWWYAVCTVAYGLFSGMLTRTWLLWYLFYSSMALQSRVLSMNRWIVKSIGTIAHLHRYPILPVAMPYFIHILTCWHHICNSYPRLTDYRFISRQLVRSPVHGSQDNWVLPIILMRHMWWGRGWFCLCPFYKIAKINIHNSSHYQDAVNTRLQNN